MQPSCLEAAIVLQAKAVPCLGQKVSRLDDVFSSCYRFPWLLCGMLIQLNKDYLQVGRCFHRSSLPLISETNMHCVTAWLLI